MGISDVGSSGAQQKDQKSNRSRAKKNLKIVLLWTWNLIRPHFRHHKRRDLYESHFIPTWALFALRTLIFLYTLAITIYRPINGAEGGQYLTYFTNINWILLMAYFGLMVLYTATVHALKWVGLAKEEPANGVAANVHTETDTSTETETDEEQGTATDEPGPEQPAAAQDSTADGRRWTRLKKFLHRHPLDLDKRVTFDMVLWMFFALIMVTAVYLDIIFWAAIYGTSDSGSSNESSETTITFYTVNAHAINAAFVLIEIVFSKLRIYPFQILYVVGFAAAYMVFMWIWFGATDDWIYGQLSWNDGYHTLYYFGVLGALVAVFVVLYLLTLVREALARIVKKKMTKRRAEKEARRSQSAAGSDERPGQSTLAMSAR